MQYYCDNPKRRLKVFQNNQINGIDYLEVVSLDQKTLKIKFIHVLTGETGGIPNGTGIDPLKVDNIIIEGGIRIKNINVVNISSSEDEITIQVDNAGDFSTYTLRLVTSRSNLNTPQGYDPQLAYINFSFKANCPSEFDCNTVDDCQEEKTPDPRISYLAKDYASFRRLALDRLSLLMPDWQERSAADLQIALVELMAYTGDYLSYYQDAVATEAILFKARKRTSVRRHARLLDYHVHDGCNARTWIHLEVKAGGGADTNTLNSATLLFSKSPDNQVMINSVDKNKVFLEKELYVFETKHDLKMHADHNEILFYTWDDSDCCLPTGATKATLIANDGFELKLEEGQVLIFEEVKGRATGNPADADPNYRHAVRLI